MPGVSTAAGRPPGPGEPSPDLTFAPSDLGRDEEEEEPRPRAAASARTAGGDELPWLVRNGGAPVPAPPPNDGTWTVRRTEQWDRHVAGTMRRLRQEAVNFTWTAAWLAISNGERRRRR